MVPLILLSSNVMQFSFKVNAKSQRKVLFG